MQTISNLDKNELISNENKYNTYIINNKILSCCYNDGYFSLGSYTKIIVLMAVLVPLGCCIFIYCMITGILILLYVL